MVFASKKGMTIVEMMVAIAIFTLVMGGFTLLANRTWSSNRSALEQATATVLGSRTLSKMIKELREARQAQDGAYPIKTVEAYEIVFYADTDGDGAAERVHYFLDGETLKRGETEFSGGAYAAADEEVATLLNYVTNETNNKPLFYYYGNDYPGNTDSNPMASPMAQDVKLIKVNPWVNIKPITAPENVNFESFVELRNLNEY